MANDYIDFERVKELSEIDKDVELSDKVVKLFEEGGELAQAVLAFKGAKNKSASASGDVLEVVEEALDVMNVAADIINIMDVDSKTIREISDRKLSKWFKKAMKYKE